MTLPSVVMSGTTPQCSCAPPMPTLYPQMTSSKMRSTSWARVISLTPWRYPSSGRTGPMFPITGSMMNAATSFLRESRSSNASGSL